MSLSDDYSTGILALLARIRSEEEDSIDRAAEAVAERLLQDRLIHVLGPGAHSFMGAEEMIYRSGGLVQVNAILDSGYSMVGGALRSTAIERTPGYAQAILKSQGLQPGDVLIIVNAYGVNCGAIDAALYAHQHGVSVIAVTSVEHAHSLPGDHPARHPSRQNLYELADIVVDTKVPVGDAILTMEGMPQKVGPVSTFANAFALNLISLRAMEKCLARGWAPPVWQSGNSPGGDEANRANIARYAGRIRHL
ncbi:MAG TPA: SIS domain-containing protein [Anaerolineae bacterium]|nr:SIS domain-containing protein [Anaerolineae bacterium]HOQ98692.1 SIS domain-containing protein [Anaerolineae bacterium]HPL29430.1 SIS domain-containing protein [Anaerolineae bacterium]